ncbi:hypothetical protein DL96DRAFT_1563620 [Flagelloscypha sp. PMI_526]|nr:hypothetical protein DL96DRAFT_1563620 [Flagelloscypha sp. PMI_526]
MPFSCVSNNASDWKFNSSPAGETLLRFPSALETPLWSFPLLIPFFGIHGNYLNITWVTGSFISFAKAIELSNVISSAQVIHQSQPCLEESFDKIRREFDLLPKENSMLRQQRDVNQQMNELTAMHNAVSQLEALHLHAKREYEHHISKLHEKLQRQQASTSSPSTKSPTMRDERPLLVPVPPSVFQRPLKPLSTDKRNGFAGGTILSEPELLQPVEVHPHLVFLLQPPGWRWKGMYHAAIPGQVKGNGLITRARDQAQKQMLGMG